MDYSLDHEESFEHEQQYEKSPKRYRKKDFIDYQKSVPLLGKKQEQDRLFREQVLQSLGLDVNPQRNTIANQSHKRKI
jgi:hypothetical protein